jgi:hypothetical protein
VNTLTFEIFEKEKLMTIVGSQIIFPKGNETVVNLTKQAPGPLPCPSGDIIAPFAAFPAPAPGTSRWYRLKAVYFDENAGGQCNVQIIFTMTSGEVIKFTLPQVASGAGASNFQYSDWYKPGTVNAGYCHITAYFSSAAPYNNSAGIYSLILEAHDA